MYLRRRTRAWIAALATLALTAGLTAALFYLPAAPSSAVGAVDAQLPLTTTVVVGGTPVAQLPPPDVPARQPASRLDISAATTVVTITETLRERPPYIPPQSPSLAHELRIPAAAVAGLRPELSEHRVYAAGEQPVVGPTAQSRELAQRYLAALNAVRAQQNLAALRWDPDLALRAEGHATTRLWYFLVDGGQRVSGPRAAQIDAYFGAGRTPRYATIGLSSHGLPTTLLVDASDEAAIARTLTGADGRSLYGAGSLPVARVGVGIALAQNGGAPVPHGWLTILFQ